MWAWERGRGGFSTVNLLYVVYRLPCALTYKVFKNMHLKELQREKSIGETGAGTKENDYSSFEYVQRNEVYGKRVSWTGEREQEKKEVSK